MSFYEYNGDLIGLPTDKNHTNYRWDNPDCKILFSMCRQGNGASLHLASDKKGLRKVKQAATEFIDFVFKTNDWCEMVFGKIKPEFNSTRKIAEKVGFTLLGFDNDCYYYYFPREVYYE